MPKYAAIKKEELFADKKDDLDLNYDKDLKT